MPDVRATFVASTEALLENPVAGAIAFYDRYGTDTRAGFEFVCPCGCGGMGRVAFRSGASDGWTWNGDRYAPTVQPSIYFCRGQAGEWHGYLTDGVWKPC